MSAADLRESVARALVGDRSADMTMDVDGEKVPLWKFSEASASAALRAIADAGFVIVKGPDLAALAGEPDLDKRIRILARMAEVDHILRTEKDMEELRYGLTAHAALSAALKEMG